MKPFDNIPEDTVLDLIRSGIYFTEYSNVKDAMFAEWMIKMEYW